MKTVSYRVALGGIVSALCIVTMFAAGIMPALYIVLPMISGILMMIIAEEVSIRWAFLTYTAVSLLSLIVTFDKEAALLFIMIFGHYPLLRIFIQKIKLKSVRRMIKLILFNICVLGYFYVTVYVMGLDDLLEEFDDMGKYGAYILLGMSNVVFIMYDINIDICHKGYLKKIMPVIRRRQ